MQLGGDAPAVSAEFQPDQPGHASWLFPGGKDPARGGYLKTADDAPLNKLTFRGGYTIEAFVKLADDGQDYSWESLLSRMGTGADAGKTDSDPSEPVANLAFSGGRRLQWAVYPLDRNDTFTNRGHEQVAGQWFHLAVVNDGRHSSLYVDSSPLLRSPRRRSRGCDCRQAVAARREPLRQRDRAGFRRPPRRTSDRHSGAEAVPVPERLVPAATCRGLGHLLVRWDRIFLVKAHGWASRPTTRGAKGGVSG